MARYISIICGLLLLALAAFGAGLYSGGQRNAIYDAADLFTKNLLGEVRMLRAEVASGKILQGSAAEFVQPAMKDGAGVTVNARPGDGGLIMLSGFFEGGNEIRLIRRDGTVVQRWPVAYYDIFSKNDWYYYAPKSNLNVDMHGALLTRRGEVLFNFEYGGIVKLDQCGEVLWSRQEPMHHSVAPATGGGYWVPGRYVYIGATEADRFPPFTDSKDRRDFQDDLIVRLSEDGDILESQSIPQILYDSGLKPLMTANGNNFAMGPGTRQELVHSNKIVELTPDLAAAFPLFEAGDLAVSLRNLNTIAVIDRETWTVKWHQTGPWLRQHDPEFTPDGRISIFNNNMFGDAYDASRYTRPDAPRVSEIVAIDPVTRETEVVYGNRPGQEFLSVIRGKHQLLPDGGMMITEFDGGRAFEVGAEGRIVWEYINRVSEDFVGEITEARLYPATYFEDVDWSCGG
ncbi:MAG: hypothetical protein HUJ27_13705 [Rhodobacteraceae bacterium]|nr:hypothetical protein [Paracoccaceae bacterium]